MGAKFGRLSRIAILFVTLSLFLMGGLKTDNALAGLNEWTRFSDLGGWYYARTLIIDPHDPNTMFSVVRAQYGNPFVIKTNDGGKSWTRIDSFPIDSGDGQFNVALAIHPKDSRIVFAATSCHGVYKSTDGGQTFSQKSNGLPLSCPPQKYGLAYSAIAIDPQDPNNIYVGTVQDGLYGSYDGGETWTFLDIDGEYSWILSIAIDPKDSSIVYYSSGLGVYKSLDRGKTWQAIRNGLPQHIGETRLKIDSRTNTIYLATAMGAYKSLDGGKQWNLMGATTLPAYFWEDLVLDPSFPNILYVSVYGSGIFKSTDGGETWENINYGSEDATRVTSLAIDPRNPSIIYAGSWFVILRMEQPTFTINASSTGCAKIDPSGEILVPKGSSQAFTINTPKECPLVDVLIDGQSKGPVTSYTFSAIDQNHSIQAIGSLVIYAKAVSPGGTISPSGAVYVKPGSDLTFKMTPQPGYRINDVKVDGKSQGAVATYTFKNIRDKHSIEASFTSKWRIGPPPIKLD